MIIGKREMMSMNCYSQLVDLNQRFNCFAI